MRKVKHILFIFYLLQLSLMLQGQKSLYRQAEKQYAAHNFVRASQLWQKAFSQTDNAETKKELAFRVGSSFHRMNLFEPALQWYADAIGNSNDKPDWLLAQADAYLRNGNLPAAKASIEKVLEVEPSSSEGKRIMLLIDSFENSKMLSYPKLFPANALNTASSDYAAGWFNNDLILSSSRSKEKTLFKDGRTSEDFSALYLSIENLYGDFGPAIPLPIDDNKNIGVVSFDPKKNRLYFTKCNNRKQKCTILQTDFDAATFAFSRPVRPAFVQKKYHYGHPFLREDGKVMYFSATLPDGYGGNDIYSITLKADGSWGLPINAGAEVNTAFDEVFPTAIGDSILIFSSTGHNTGYGGLDLYTVRNKGTGFERLQLLLPPYNSSADDFSLSLRKNSTKGILTSNRNTSTGDDLYFFDDYPLRRLVSGMVINPDSVPLDGAFVKWSDTENHEWDFITTENGAFYFSVPDYSNGTVLATHPDHHPSQKQVKNSQSTTNQSIEWVVLQPRGFAIQIKGKVTDRDTNLPMEGVSVSLSGPKGYFHSTKTGSDGVYRFDTLQPERIYTVKVSGDSYFSESRVLRVPEPTQDMILEKSNGYDFDFELTKISEKKEITLNNIYYDFDKATLRESSVAELQKLISMLRETPGVNVQISSHTDERGANPYNNKLSQARAQSVVNYLIAGGIEPSRLVAKGFGKTHPIYKNAISEEQHQANRRTTFQVVNYNSDQTLSPHEETKPQTKQTEKTINQRLQYRVQMLVSSKKYDPEVYFAALKNAIPQLVFYITEVGAAYRYEAGNRNSLGEAEVLRSLIRSFGFPDSFIVSYIDQQRVTLQQAKDFKP